MHDCPKIQEKILDLVFNEIEPAEQKHLFDEVALCAFCQAEMESYQKTLELYDCAVATSELTAAEWHTVEVNLQKNFVRPKSAVAGWCQQIIFGTVQVPAPVLAAAALFVCGITFFALRPVSKQSQKQIVAESAQPATPASNSLPINAENARSIENSPENAEEKSTEKVVVREVERVVTRNIYIIKKTNSPKQPKTIVADAPVLETDSNPLNLAEFKPVRPVAIAPIKAVKENKP